MYQCPAGYVYNPTTNLCKRKIWLSDCPKINCAANKNNMIVYPGSPGYYIYCMYVNQVLTPIISKCLDPVNLAYNIKTSQCEIACKTEGRFADAELCSNYYECYYSGFKLVGRQQSCLSGFIYNATNHVCQLGTCPVT